MHLSEEQKIAVDAGPIDLLISAGAGSGKTRVLTARFVHAVLGVEPYAPVAPDRLLTVTFTERAAGELAERIRSTLIASGAHERSRYVENAWISTIHGMCARVLRENAFDAGLDPRFAIADEVSAGMLAHEAMEEALSEALERGDEDIQSLVETMTYEDLRETVVAVHGNLQSMGATAADISTLDRRDVAATVERISCELRQIRDQIVSSCDTGLKKTQGNIVCIDQAIDAAESFAKGRGELPSSMKSPSRTGRHEVHDGLVTEAKSAIEQLALCSAQLVVEPLEQAVIRLLHGFERRYADLKSERSLLDFEDLQSKVVDLFDRCPDVAAAYRDRFSMVMIDEFQDTNPLQVRIARHLTNGNLCTVGDEKQSIYAFRHADIEVFRERQRNAPHQASLQDNYRSHPELLSFFNSLFGAGAFFGDTLMHLKPGREAADESGWPAGFERVRVLFPSPDEGSEVDRHHAEAIVVADELARLRDGGVPQGDMVVLLRKVKDVAECFADELRARGFDVFVASGGTYFETPEARELIALLRLVDNVLDDEAALVVLAGRLTGVSDDALYRLREHAGVRGALWAAACEADELRVSEGDQRVIARVVEVVGRMRRMRSSVPLRDLLMDACERLDYDLVLFGSGPDGPRAWANVLKLARMAEEFERATHGDIGSFLDHLASREAHAATERQATIAGDGTQAVRIMSVHAAKGLEFPVVAVASFSGGVSVNERRILVAGSEGTLLLGMQAPQAITGETTTGSKWLPTLAHSRLRTAAREADAEEVKRLLYVACTRAEKGLILCLSDDLSRPASEKKVPGMVRVALGLGEPVTEEDLQDSCRRAACATVDIVPVGAPDESESTRGIERSTATCSEPPELAPQTERAETVPGYPATVSYSGLEAYRRCSYRYLAERVIGVSSELRTSSGGSGARGFGDAFHEAMRETWEGQRPSPSRLTAILRERGLSDAEKGRLQAALDAFDASSLAPRVASAERLVAECPIDVSVRGSVLVGSIDLIAWSGDRALIVDYKTGRGELTPDEAHAKYKMQGACYALAALKAGATSVDVVFFEPERSGRTIEYSYGPGDSGALEELIGDVLDDIAAGRFEPLESYDTAACGECAVQGTLCPLTPSDAD